MARAACSLTEAKTNPAPCGGTWVNTSGPWAGANICSNGALQSELTVCISCVAGATTRTFDATESGCDAEDVATKGIAKGKKMGEMCQLASPFMCPN